MTTSKHTLGGEEAFVLSEDQNGLVLLGSENS